MPRALKWAPPNTVYAGRVKKRPSATLRPAGKQILHDTLANNNSSHSAWISKLESEIASANETLSTIIVMFDSLRHAYASSKYEMDMCRCETRLSEKEKELLSAYDDLGHQVIHLERQVRKLESKLADLKSARQQDTASPVTPYDEDPESPYDTLIDQKQYLIDPFAALTEPDTAAPAFAFYSALPTIPSAPTAPSLIPVAIPLSRYDTETVMLMEMLYQDPSPWWPLPQQPY
ncbi:hypothetical protein BX666DRAFT_2067184 [Dichotomocladium elegans]|nr:hypothetical protein BX666DRAFT_2067184 [Dichotomocladium elegans]